MDTTPAALAAAAVFARSGLRYALGGGLASILYGEPRTTLDVDFALALTSWKVDRFLRFAHELFHVDDVEARVAAREMRMFSIIHRPDFVKVDLHVVPDEGLHRIELDRARWLRVGEGPDDEVLVASAEDVLIRKLCWFRLGGEVSERQWRDVLGILKVRGRSLDLAYMRRWCEEEGVLDLLERALKESGSASAR